MNVLRTLFLKFFEKLLGSWEKHFSLAKRNRHPKPFLGLPHIPPIQPAHALCHHSRKCSPPARIEKRSASPTATPIAPTSLSSKSNVNRREFAHPWPPVNRIQTYFEHQMPLSLNLERIALSICAQIFTKSGIQTETFHRQNGLHTRFRFLLWRPRIRWAALSPECHPLTAGMRYAHHFSHQISYMQSSFVNYAPFLFFYLRRRETLCRASDRETIRARTAFGGGGSNSQ